MTKEDQYQDQSRSELAYRSARLTSEILQFGRGLLELLRELPMPLRELPVFMKELLEGSGTGIGADLAIMKC